LRAESRVARAICRRARAPWIIASRWKRWKKKKGKLERDARHALNPRIKPKARRVIAPAFIVIYRGRQAESFTFYRPRTRTFVKHGPPSSSPRSSLHQQRRFR
jgi:hypothetical protein